MKLVFGIKTYNRLEYLKKILLTWDFTRNKKHNWTLIVVDDGSKDGSINFIDSLKFQNVKLIPIKNNRRGVHHSANQILKISKGIKFDLGFMAEDDCYFSQPGWDDLYIDAVRASSFDHLCYFNIDWCQKFRKDIFYKFGRRPNIVRGKKIQSNISDAANAFGVFWTFTQNVIQKVGFFDLQNMGLCGGGHTDYTLRCCRAGFNKRKPLYDAIGSNRFIKMHETDYIHSITFKERAFAASLGGLSAQKKDKVKAIENRIYVKYNELSYNMLGESV